jgi:hypothetical protein
VRDDPGRSCRDAAPALADCSRVTVRASCMTLHVGVRMEDVSCQRIGSLSLSGRPRRHCSKLAPLRERSVNVGMQIIASSPWGFSLWLKIVRTAAGACMFLLLPGLLPMQAFVRTVAFAATRSPRSWWRHGRAKASSQSSYRAPLLLRYCGALPARSELCWPNCRIRIPLGEHVGEAAVLIQALIREEWWAIE